MACTAAGPRRTKRAAVQVGAATCSGARWSPSRLDETPRAGRPPRRRAARPGRLHGQRDRVQQRQRHVAELVGEHHVREPIRPAQPAESGPQLRHRAASRQTHSDQRTGRRRRGCGPVRLDVPNGADDRPGRLGGRRDEDRPRHLTTRPARADETRRRPNRRGQGADDGHRKAPFMSRWSAGHGRRTRARPDHTGGIGCRQRRTSRRPGARPSRVEWAARTTGRQLPAVAEFRGIPSTRHGQTGWLAVPSA